MWARGASAGRSQQRLLRAWAVLGRQGCHGGVCFGVRAAVRSSELMLWPPRCRLLLEHTCAWGLEQRLRVTRSVRREGTCPRGWGCARGFPSMPKEEVLGPQRVLGQQEIATGLKGFPFCFMVPRDLRSQGHSVAPPNIQLEDGLGVGKDAGTTCVPLFFIACGAGAGCSGGRRGHRG